MGQVLIRNLDDALLADYREAAKRTGRSLEAELREALIKVRPMSEVRRSEVLDELARIRAMTPKGVTQTPGWQLIREERDRR